MVVMEQQTSLRLSAELLRRLDEWCAAQPLKPTRAQAIRSFIEEALKPHDWLEAHIKLHEKANRDLQDAVTGETK